MGLLAKATAYLENQEKLAAEAVAAENIAALVETSEAFKKLSQLNLPNLTVHNHQRTAPVRRETRPVTTVVKKRHSGKLRKLAIGLFMGLAIQTTTPLAVMENGLLNNSHKDIFAQDNHFARNNEIIRDFETKYQSRVSNEERDMLAKMLYGEAGRGADAFEVLHTVLNRYASPLFKGSIADLVTAKDQYLGYRPENPVTEKYRAIVDMGVGEWEAHGRKVVNGCRAFYFVTDEPGISNKFEDCQDGQGHWIEPSKKKYAPRQHYCSVANDQAARFFAEHDYSL